jgi:hypothetical protein
LKSRIKGSENDKKKAKRFEWSKVFERDIILKDTAFLNRIISMNGNAIVIGPDIQKVFGIAALQMKFPRSL